MEQMLGSYSVKSGENQDGIIIKNFPEEDSPSGMIARSGTYNVKSRVVDDDGHIYAGMSPSFTHPSSRSVYLTHVTLQNGLGNSN